MTAEQAVSRYVAEILRVVSQRARIEVEVVEAARQMAARNGYAGDVVRRSGEIAADVVRRRMWGG